MKKVLTFVIATLTTIISFAQAQTQNENVSTQNSSPATYQLFPTQNIWTFIKLDTRNGQMWQVQFGMKDNKRFATNLNSDPLVTQEKELNGRFTLYSTQISDLLRV